MKILLINQYVITPNFPGGTRHFSLLKRLVKKGHTAVAIGSKSRHMKVTDQESRFYQEYLEDVRFCWLRIPKYEGNTLTRVFSMVYFAVSAVWFQIFRAKFKPDIVWATSPHLFQGISGYLLARFYRVPFILEIRDLWPQTFLDLGNYTKWHPFIVLNLFLEKFLYRRADKIVTLLPGSQQHIITKGGASEKIVWIPNGIDISIFEQSKSLAREKINGTVNCLYSGAHGLANNLDSILDAAKLLLLSHPNISFDFIGDGPHRSRLMQRVKDEHITNAHFLGPVDKSEILSKCQEADILLESKHDTPLYRWGFSFNKIYDYMAAAKPIILAIDSPYQPVEEARCGITVSPGNARSFADAVVAISKKSAAECRQLGESGKAYVFANHSFDVLAERFEAEVLT